MPNEPKAPFEFDKPCYSEKETWKMLSISRSTLNNERNAERIKPIHIGRRVLYTAVEIARFIRARDGE